MHAPAQWAGRRPAQGLPLLGDQRRLPGHFKFPRTGSRLNRRRTSSDVVAWSAPQSLAAAAAVGAAALCAAAWLSRSRRADVWARGEFNLAVLARCPALVSEYRRFSFCFNGHAETIWGALARRGPRLALRREVLRLDDGGVVTLDWEGQASQGLPDDAPIVILIAGLAGGSKDTYVQYAMQSTGRMGMRPVVFNCRGTANGPMTTPQFYSASFTMDLRGVVAHLGNTQPGVTLLAMGWSLGANILLNYLGEEGATSPIKAAVSLVNPFNLVVSDRALKSGMARLYDRNLGLTMGRMFRPHAPLFRGHMKEDRVQAALNAQTVRDFDEAITSFTFGWADVDAYYRGSGSCNKISRIQVPFLCVQALDDPIAVKEAIPYEDLERNPYCTLVLTETGGHLGWVQAKEPYGAPWSDVVSAEWLASVMKELKARSLRVVNGVNGSIAAGAAVPDISGGQTGSEQLTSSKAPAG
ncbi:unnamed protein product [Ostreobium quekettii]|uniref:AB hydrolase-1 domain-containing protein n=1 Tax=Ostreobium quekettii TaxID=121088 RepID=A0A8S1IQJ0_9CHLO|nr:unnamed protein product [Ostreobium quekettii]|eukprot:evm.model.scf_728EXC.9 EVM.evm.TU.scf_728EXC.9   scf_728EXC:49900-54355(+)